MDAGEAGPARARVGVDVVGARGAVLARGAEALVDLQGAAVTHETRQAAAVEGVDLVRAGSPVEARIWRRQGHGFSGGRVDHLPPLAELCESSNQTNRNVSKQVKQEILFV